MNFKIFTRIIKDSSKLYVSNGVTMRRYPLVLKRNMALENTVKKRKESFMEAWPGIAQNILNSNKLVEIPDVPKWLKEVYDYNLQGGKKNRGLTTVLSYEMLENPEKITEEMLKLVRVLGWCVELMQAFFIMLDDIIDGSEMRRGSPCWYRVPGVGLNAINDALLVQGTIYQLLRTHFHDKPYYNKIVDLFNETFLNTSSGQYLDIVTANRKKNDYNMFTMERYNAIVKYKTSYYSYVLPVCLGLTLTGHTERAALDHLENLCLQIGCFFQVQDDYIDCFGSSKITGKIGTDIQEGKCTWLAVQALMRCNNSQRVVFTTCYGSKEPAHIERIIELYRKLGLPSVYQELERNVRYSLRAAAANPPPHAGDALARAPELFERLFDDIYQRTS